MNIAVIFAGGVGKRMHTRDKPKQFLMVHGKPIVVHTVEVFEKHPMVDGVVIACVSTWLEEMEELVRYYRLDKVARIVPGGETGQLSIYNGLKAAEEAYGVDGNYVLVHDGVRPLVSSETITENVTTAIARGSAITCVPAKETVVLVDDSWEIESAVDRPKSLIARAPQTFRLEDILGAHEKALKDGKHDFIDSCTLMQHYGYQLVAVQGNMDNIKVTTPEDFYTFRAIYDARENEQLF